MRNGNCSPGLPPGTPRWRQWPPRGVGDSIADHPPASWGLPRSLAQGFCSQGSQWLRHHTMEAGRGVLEEEEPSGWMGGLCPRIWEGEASCEVEKFLVLPAGPHSCSSRPPSDPRNHGKSSSSFMPYKELPWKANH